MSTFKTYISYVVQKGNQHVHGFEIIDFPLPKYSFYLDNSSQQVVKWAEEKQKTLSANEKIIILNFFNVSNVK
jgi:hypothetical protein